MVAYTRNPERPRQENCCKCKASLRYIVSFWPAQASVRAYLRKTTKEIERCQLAMVKSQSTWFLGLLWRVNEMTDCFTPAADCPVKNRDGDNANCV